MAHIHWPVGSEPQLYLTPVCYSWSQSDGRGCPTRSEQWGHAYRYGSGAHAEYSTGSAVIDLRWDGGRYKDGGQHPSACQRLRKGYPKEISISRGLGPGPATSEVSRNSRKSRKSRKTMSLPTLGELRHLRASKVAESSNGRHSIKQAANVDSCSFRPPHKAAVDHSGARGG